MTRRLFVAVLFFLAVWVGFSACRTRPIGRIEPLPAAATEALARAQFALRSNAKDREARAKEALAEALAIAPRWVAPRRLSDEIARGELRGVEALEAHIAALALAPNDAGELYLAGRLEGFDGIERFERAVRADPDLAWGHHGLAWAAGARGRTKEACEHARDALLRARDPWERTFFTQNLARCLVAADRRDAALELLESRRGEDEVSLADRASLDTEATEIELESKSARERTASYERGLEILSTTELADAEVEELVARMRLLGSFEDIDGSRLMLALAARAGPSRDRLRAELMLDSGATPLALGLFERALGAQGRDVPAGALGRAARFAAGDFSGAVERWRAELPSAVLAQNGEPSAERLARIVRAARALSQDAPKIAIAPGLAPTTRAERDRAALAELGDAAIDAGWFREARCVAVKLAAFDLDSALALDARSLAGLEFLEGVRRAMRRVDRDPLGRARPIAISTEVPRASRMPGSATTNSNSANSTAANSTSPNSTTADSPSTTTAATNPTAASPWQGRIYPRSDGEPPALRSLDALLGSLAPLVARANVFLGGETDVTKIAAEIQASPRMKYAGVAELVHPGPRFSADDERDELGRPGDKVDGLAPILARFGRFGLFGEVSGGGGPDATLLPMLHVEQRSGDHLGGHWHGTIAYCESADLKSRAGRRGAQISAAALHEGYWVDVDSVRAELAAWRALQRRFSGEDAVSRVASVLDARGLSLADDATSADRRRTGSLLGEGQRVRLAVLRDRASAGSALGDMTLDELLVVTGNHEEGHLCDRERFLPISQHKLAILGLLLDCGFSPTRVSEELEYRAQLTCIAVAPDARVALAMVLDSVEGGPSGLTPHAAGYARLLTDLVAILDDDSAHYTSLDRAHTIAHQLHALSSDEVRRAARALAKKKGLL